MLVEIWSDVVCPWCYIGKRRFEAALERFEHKDDVQVRWRSFELDPSAPAQRTGEMAEHLASKYGMTLADAEARLESLNQLAAQDGLDYDLAHTKSGNTFSAHRLIHMGYDKDPETGAALKEALLAAYFADLRPIGEVSVLADVGERCGLDRDEVVAMLASDRFEKEVRADEEEASALGCSGVPFFVIDRAVAVPGAQDVDTFLMGLRRAWAKGHQLEAIGGGAGGACEDGGCPV